MGTIVQSLAHPAGMVADAAWVSDVTSLINSAGASMTPTVTTLTATGTITGNAVVSTTSVSSATVAATGAITGASVTATGNVGGATVSSAGALTAPAILNSGVVHLTNNALTAYTVAANKSLVRFSGTNAASIAFTLPAGASGIDGLSIKFSSEAAVATLTWASTGATFVGAPAAFVANTPFELTYFHATTTWEITG